MMNVLITGINGFLGKQIYNRIKNEHTIAGVYHKNIDHDYFDDCQLIPSDSLAGISQTPEVIILTHAAVSSGSQHRSNDDLYESNVKFTQQIVDLFPTSYFIYISSASVYGLNNSVINENTLPNPLSAYAVSKLWAERVVLNKTKSCVLRLTSVFGEFMQEGTIIPNYVNQALTTKTIQVWGSGNRRQNYIHVKEVTDYVFSLIKTQHEGIFLAASSTDLSNIELAQIISNHTGASIEFVKEDYSPSLLYDNNTTKQKLSITHLNDTQNQLISYIEWKRKQF